MSKYLQKKYYKLIPDSLESQLFYKFFFATPSQPARAIKSLMLQGGARQLNLPSDSDTIVQDYRNSINFEQHDIDLYGVEHKSKEYKAICPDGVVPYIIEYKSINDF